MNERRWISKFLRAFLDQLREIAWLIAAVIFYAVTVGFYLRYIEKFSWATYHDYADKLLIFIWVLLPFGAFSWLAISSQP